MKHNGLRVLQATTGTPEKEIRVSASLDRTKRVLVQQTAAMLIAVGLVAIVMALRVAPLPTSTLIAALIGLGVCAVSIALARSRMPVVVSASCLIASWLAALFVVAYMRGGLEAPLLIAVPIVPVIAATVMSRRAAWIVLAFILIGLATLTGLELGGHVFPQSAFASPQFDLMRGAWVALSSLMSTKLATYNTMRSETLTHQLQQLALTDALTGVANRRAIVSLLHAEVARAQRNNSPLALLILDVDHFKQMNDMSGHLAGDEALARIARAIADGLRVGGDAIGRWGGEEFIVILPHTTTREAAQAAERIRLCVADLDIRYHSQSAEVVTVTVGVACHAGTSVTSADELLHTADEALYRGKAQGRNRVVLADEPSAVVESEQ